MEEELDQTEKLEVGIESKDEHADFSETILGRRIRDLNKEESTDSIRDIFTAKPIEIETDNMPEQIQAMLWHVRLGHASSNYLKELQKLEESLNDVIYDESILECEICIMAKMERLPFRDKRTRAIRSLEIIHMDTMGPTKSVSHPGGKRFITVFVDDHTRLARACSMKSKDETGKYLKRFLTSARNLLGKDEKVCYVRSDQETELTGGEFLDIRERRHRK